MLTLDERIRKILTTLAKEPSKPALFIGDEGWQADWRDECALCGGEQKWSKKDQRFIFTHDAGCIVAEAQQILRDHP